MKARQIKERAVNWLRTMWHQLSAWEMARIAPELSHLPQIHQLWGAASRAAYRDWRLWPVIVSYALPGLLGMPIATWAADTPLNPGLPDPLWVGFFTLLFFCLVLSGALPLHLRIIGSHLRRQLPQLCSDCGYVLTGNTSGVCPECGREIERQGKKT